MQFKVPQFIDVEDKLFGPLTLRQFIYLAGGAGAVFVLIKLFPLWLALVPMIFVAGLSLMLAFYKINEKPFIHYLQAGINYFVSSKLYIWKQRLVKPNDTNKKERDSASTQMVSIVPMLSSSKLNDLSWSLDVEEKKNN